MAYFYSCLITGIEVSHFVV